MKSVVSLITLCLLATPALADWTVTQDGAAIIENAGISSIELRCDNNSNTGNRPSWLVMYRVNGLNTMAVPQDVNFRFPASRPLYMHGENRNGAISFEGMNAPTNGDLNLLVQKLKAASRVTVEVNGQESTFSLKGSSKAIGSVAAACR